MNVFRNIFAFFKTRAAAALVLAAVALSIFVTTARGQLNGFLTPHRIDTIVFGLCVSAATAVFIEAFPYVQPWFEARTKQGKFLRFFGHVTSETRGAILLFAKRTFPAGSQSKSRAEENGLVPPGVDAEPEGITSWIPGQDLRGANYVAGELAKMVKMTAFYRTDVDLETDQLDQIRATVFSFGLGFNEFTYRIITATDRKLFTVNISKSSRSSFEPITDNIDIAEYGILQPEEGVDCAIVARVVHASPEGSPSRYFFICAGRTATGTAVAGRYLANKWLDLFNAYKDEKKDLDKHSLLVVLSHKYNPKHGEDDLGEIATYSDGTKLMKWWEPEPVAMKTRDDDSKEQFMAGRGIGSLRWKDFNFGNVAERLLGYISNVRRRD